MIYLLLIRPNGTPVNDYTVLLFALRLMTLVNRIITKFYVHLLRNQNLCATKFRTNVRLKVQIGLARPAQSPLAFELGPKGFVSGLVTTEF